MLKKIIMNSKHLFSTALTIKEVMLKKNSINLQKNEQAILDELFENGIAVIPNFFSKDECNKMIDVFNAIEHRHATFRYNDKRVFGIQYLSSIHKKLFHDNQMFKKTGEAYIGDELVLQTTMAAKIVAQEGLKLGSGGGWHRDSFSRQFKAVTYLSDVSIDNGPFMYIKGSHKMKNIKIVLHGLKEHIPISGYRYTNQEIEKIQSILGEKITYYTAPKGTLILVDTRGLHTGMPIAKGLRYSVFNYYIAKSFQQINSEIEQLDNQSYINQ